MAAAVDIDTKEIEFCIRGLLVSRPTVAKANVLQRECEEELGKPFPLRQLGVPTFLDYLRSIPNVVQLQPHNGYNPDVYPVASRASSHIDQLVSRQRVTRPRRRGVARQSAYGSRATSAPVRRRPSRVVSRSFPSVVRSNQVDQDTLQPLKLNQDITLQHLDPKFMRNVLWDLVKELAISWKNGVNVRDFERHMRSNYDERDLTRNGIQNVNSLLSQAEGIVEQSGTKVYPKFPSFSENTDRGCHNGIPAGYEDDLDDFDDVSDFYEEEVERDSEEEMSKQAIQLWTKALGVQEKDSSMSHPGKEEETGAGNSRESTHYEDQMYCEPEDDNNISKKMIDNFRKILNEYPDGIWASELPALYFDQFHVQLNALELGYSSMIGLVSNLPNVFSFKKVGSHDWKVYDARYIAQENLDSDGNLSTENGRFIPQTIIENIKKLLVNNSNGFKSIDLLKKYQETFRKSLDLESLGFHTLEEFLEILKNHITLKKGLNCYILLPKHTVVSHEAMEPPKPDERLNVPAESLCVPVPINVMRLGEEIPLQELPPVQDDPLKPLLELEVRVAEVMSPVFFYITLSSMYEEMESMMDDLHKFYEWEQENLQIPLPHFAVGLYCAAKYGEFWHRAKISRIMSNGDIGIEYIDYGTPKTVKNSELRYLSKEFTTLPTQAICAKLIGVRPVDEKATQFPTSACQNFLGLVLDKRLVAHVYEVGARVRFRQERMQLELILFDVSGKEEIVINDYLIDNGFASPITQIQDVPTEIDDVVENFEEYELTSLQTNGSTTPLPLSESPLLPENGLPENTISFPASSNTREEVKPVRPPPGFENFQPEPNPIPLSIPNFPSEFSIPNQSTQKHLTNSESQPSAYKFAEKEQNVLNCYFVVNNVEKRPELMMQDQYLPQNVYQPNQSNMPLLGSPLFQLPKQNISQETLPYDSCVPPPNPYNPHQRFYRQQEYHNVPNNYFPANYEPKNIPAPSNFMFMKPAVPQPYGLMNTPVPNPYYGVYPPGYVHLPPNMQAYEGEFSSPPPPVKAAHYRRPSIPTKLTHSPFPIAASGSITNKPSPTPSPAPAFTPITVPEWPPKNHPVYTNSAIKTEIGSSSTQPVVAPLIKSESPKFTQISRPCVPSSPSSIEVANICKGSRPTSAASDNSISKSQNLRSLSNNSQISASPENYISNSQIKISPIESPSNNATNIFCNEESEIDKCINNSGPFLNDTTDNHTDNDLDETLIPSVINIEEIPMPPSSPEKSYSAISSSVGSLFHNTPTKELSSDDYVSASENLEEIKERISYLTLKEPSKSFCQSSEDIPDTWENIELDDTPSKAENFSLDFSQPLDLIMNNDIKRESTLMSNVPDDEKCAYSLGKSQIPPIAKIQAPDNWKDGFNPDTISCSERVDNNNKEVIGKTSSPVKFYVKKIPVQKIEIQGKFFHLIYVNNLIAVLPLEFLKQFIPNNMNPTVAEKVLESADNKFHVISKAEHPDILAELEKVDEFCGGVKKKAVIRMNKVKLLSVSEIPKCLKILFVPNKPLLDDLKKVSDELESL